MKRDVFKLNNKLLISITVVVLEGLLSGCNFIVLFQILKLAFSGESQIRDIYLASAAIAGILILRLFIYSVSYVGCQIGGSDVSRNIRMGLGDKLRKIPLGMFTKNRTGYYINAATTEVSDYEQILTHKLADIAKYVILLFAVGIYAGTLYLPIGALLIIAFLMIIPTMYGSVLQVKKYGVRKNLAREENVSAITEYIQGSQVFRSYGISGSKNQTLTAAMKEYSDVSYEYERAVIPIGNLFGLAGYAVLALSMVLSVNAWLSGVISQADVILLVMLPLFSAKVNLSLYIALLSYRNLNLSREKIARILEEEEDNASGVFSPADNSIRFENVEFSYTPGEPVLSGISFSVKPNQLTAIVGASGSGKSTIFNLLCRYYRQESGLISIGGRDISHATTEQVLSNISLVDQDTFLFDDTIMNNIRYARPDATDAEIRAACVRANCDSFIQGMEQGYETRIGENGNRLSGGERQRLSIARAMIKGSPIVLLDEATASLDIENELAVKGAIANLLEEEKTVIMIAHTLSIIRNASQILVVDAGKISESGTHEELIHKKGKYQAMWASEQMLH